MSRDIDVVWLRELERRLEHGLALDNREVMVALRDQLPPGFKPSDVEQRLLYGTGPSIEGLRLLGDHARILPDVERTIRHIRDRLIENPSLAKVTAAEIAQALDLPVKRVERVLQLMSSTGGHFISGASGSYDGYSEISLGRDDVVADYLGFESLDKLLASRSAPVQPLRPAAVRHRRQEEPRQTRPSPTKRLLTHDGEADRERVLSDHMRVFISWSGDRSHKLALLLHEWLPSVIQAVTPYVSSENLQKGTRWPIDLAHELEQTAFGILCIVPSNTAAPWLNFEAGALSKFVKDARVVPLLFDLEPSALLGHPLGQFQAAKFEKREVFKTLKSMNQLLGSARLDPERLKSVFEQWWPKLARGVAAVPQDDDSLALAGDQPGSQPPRPRKKNKKAQRAVPAAPKAPALVAPQTQSQIVTVHTAPVDLNPPTDPSARLLWGAEQIKVELVVLLGNAGRLPRVAAWSDYALSELAPIAAATGVITPALAESVRTVATIRKTAIFSQVVDPGSDLAMDALQRLREIPREYVRVRHAHISLFRDRSLSTPYQQTHGVLLAQLAQDGRVTTANVYPRQTDYAVGRFVSWEWNQQRSFRDEAWYADPKTQEPKLAWSQSATFVGREYPEQWGLEYRLPNPTMGLDA
jgi:hypothetical protein